MSKDKCWGGCSGPFTKKLEVSIIPLPASTVSPTSPRATPATASASPTTTSTGSTDSLLSLVDLYRTEGMEALNEKVTDIIASPEATKELIRSAERERERFKDEFGQRFLVISKDLVALLRLTMIVFHNLEREARELYSTK